MKQRSSRSKALRWAAVVALAGIGAWPSPAAAAPESITVDSAAEAWYREAPKAQDGESAELPEAPDPCTLPVGCPAGPVATDPPVAAAYPFGSLHVEASAGKPTAHAYISPDLTFLPVGSTPLSGKLTLPVGQQKNAGSYRIQDARLVACLTIEPVTDDVYGGIRKAPAYDCDLAMEKAAYQRKEDAFTVDLGPFLEMWSLATPNFGIALVPDPKLGPDASWHVSLNGDETESGKGASSEIVYQLAPVEAPVPTSPQAPERGAVSAPVTTTSGSAPGGPPALAEAAPKGGAPAPAAAAVQPQAAPYALMNSPWYTYRGVVFLPLAFLVAISLCGRSLTRPLTRSA
jgi:hypothetical protein